MYDNLSTNNNNHDKKLTKTADQDKKKQNTITTSIPRTFEKLPTPLDGRSAGTSLKLG